MKHILISSTHDQMPSEREKEEINPNVSADRFSLPLHFFMPSCRMQAITLKKRLKLKKDNRDEKRRRENQNAE